MCGIAEIFGETNLVTLRQMLFTLLHRGPDDEHSSAKPEQYWTKLVSHGYFICYVR